MDTQLTTRSLPSTSLDVVSGAALSAASNAGAGIAFLNLNSNTT